jgi:leucyl-tRNA synthetase
MMVYTNHLLSLPVVPRDAVLPLILLVSPFAPHLGEELWQRLGHTTSVAYAPWPAHDEAKLARDTLVIAVQVGGKLRGQIEVSPDASERDILAAAQADPKVQSFVAGKPIKKAIYVKGRLVNLVV